MLKVIARIAGVLLVAVGVVIFILPIPLGFVLIGVGVAMVYGHDLQSISSLVKKQKSENRLLDCVCNFISSLCPVSIRRRFNFDSAPENQRSFD